MNRMFDPGPKTYVHVIDRLQKQTDLKYRDHTTALDFNLKATPPVSGEYEQEVFFELAEIVRPPQVETLFPPEIIS